MAGMLDISKSKLAAYFPSLDSTVAGSQRTATLVLIKLVNEFGRCCVVSNEIPNHQGMAWVTCNMDRPATFIDLHHSRIGFTCYRAPTDISTDPHSLPTGAIIYPSLRECERKQRVTDKICS